MIKEPQNYEKGKISVYLKDGTFFVRKDMTTSPLGQNERIVCFWENDHEVLVFPMDQVSHFVMHFD